MTVHVSVGSAQRIRNSYLELIAGETELLPPELVGKLRLLESALPFLCRLMRIPRAGSLADLLPAEDIEATAVLELIHHWSGQMLAGGDVVEGEASEIAGALPAAPPASSGTLEAGPDNTHPFTGVDGDCDRCGRPARHPIHQEERR